MTRRVEPLTPISKHKKNGNHPYASNVDGPLNPNYSYHTGITQVLKGLPLRPHPKLPNGGNHRIYAEDPTSTDFVLSLLLRAQTNMHTYHNSLFKSFRVGQKTVRDMSYARPKAKVRLRNLRDFTCLFRKRLKEYT